MQYRNLGRTGVRVSPLCLGCGMFGSRTDPAESAAIIESALDRGINFVDTANAYGQGRSEEVLGKTLKRSGQRDRVILATKVHLSMDPSDPNARGNSRRHIIQQCDASLSRLQTDYIDLYQLHRPQMTMAIDETLRALDDLVRAGKVRYIGTSTFLAWHIVESLWASKELGLSRVVCEQPPYNLLDRRAERELLPMAQTYGLAIIPWSPLAGGLLTGKYSRGQPPPAGSRVAEEADGTGWQARMNDATFDVVEGLEAIASEKGCTASQLAIAWCAEQSGVTSPIIGPRTMAQFEDNSAAIDVVLSEEDRTRINELIAPGTMVASFYESDVRPAAHHW